MKFCKACQVPMPNAPYQRNYCRDCGEARAKESGRKSRQRKRAEVMAQPVACPVCGLVFLRSHGRQKHCSLVCRRRYEQVLKKRRRDAERAANVRSCARCGKPMPGAYPRRLRCKPCAEVHKRLQKRVAGLEAFNAKRSCSVCAGPMPASAPRSETRCSSACVNWREVALRIAEHAGPESAALFTQELNKHRRLNGRAEVRL